MLRPTSLLQRRRPEMQNANFYLAEGWHKKKAEKDSLGGHNRALRSVSSASTEHQQSISDALTMQLQRGEEEETLFFSPGKFPI